MADGDELKVGEVRLAVLETPGHSPESISILVFDPAHSEDRPNAVRCGKNLSTDTVSTIGVQREYNYALQPMSRERFIEVVTSDQPDTPDYFTYDAVLNGRERPTLDKALMRDLEPLSLAGLIELVRQGAQLLDTREQAEFEGAHVRGALNIGLAGSFATWCGSVLDPERPVALVGEPGRELEAATRLGRIGFDTVAGFLERGIQQLAAAPELVERIERLTARTLSERLDSPDPPLLIDVRTTREWNEGHIDGAVNVPLGHLAERLTELPSDRHLIVYCASGYRAAIAVSLLRRDWRREVANLVGGLSAWHSAQLNTVVSA